MVVWEKEVCVLGCNFYKQTNRKGSIVILEETILENFESSYWGQACGRSTLPELTDKISS